LAVANLQNPDIFGIKLKPLEQHKDVPDISFHDMSPKGPGIERRGLLANSDAVERIEGRRVGFQPGDSMHQAVVRLSAWIGPGAPQAVKRPF